ncbi:hypothetical protein TD95_004967 [Thielaviopsis punctulata]|uniref:RGS domain-containing protein n=1 Tax=Thielaviopsis punctulata TaxID=72032 RepID=A0A0F4ZCD5_9PEZI|nr:hypothetical protein TD95_004967 [Thielaviopsis punctulata]
MDRVIATYIMSTARRQLHLTPTDRKRLLGSVSCSTSPATLKTVFSNIDYILRTASYPHFLHWAFANANCARLHALQLLSGLLIALSVLPALVLILSDAARPWRLFLFPPLVLALSLLLLARQRICLFLFLQGVRQVRPWEQFLDEEAVGEKNRLSITPFGPANAEYKDSWLQAYEQRGEWRKVFERTARVQEKALARVQRSVVLRNVGAATVLAVGVMGVLVSVPEGGFY